jgi:hypothetical protein
VNKLALAINLLHLNTDKRLYEIKDKKMADGSIDLNVKPTIEIDVGQTFGIESNMKVINSIETQLLRF